jgi:AcrR family transcriptional regulator
MSRDDWLVGGDRRAAAAERIYATAAEMITRHGLEAFDIDDLAARVHCSRATIYRHVGGKAQIRDVVLFRAGEQIIETVRDAVEDLHGHERITTAIMVALGRIRSDPLGKWMISSMRAQEMDWLTGSPIVAKFATDINGLTESDPLAAQWIIRILLAMLYWPVDGDVDERRMLQRFVAPAFGAET